MVIQLRSLTKLYRILIIEDEPILCQYYEGLLKEMSVNDQQFTIKVAHSFDTASNLLTYATSKQDYFDLVLLDIRLRDVAKKKTYDGEGLGIQIRKLMPNTKIMVITSHDNNFRYHTIFKSMQPDGFMIKYELSDGEFIKAIELLLEGKNYYGASVTRYLNAQIGNKNNIDDLDRRLLYLLSNCLTTKQIAKILPLSPSGVEKRKRKLSELFNLENAKTVTIIFAAKEHGYLD